MYLHLDLTENATRAYILGRLRAPMTPSHCRAYDAILEAAKIPNKHHSNLAEVYETIDSLDAPAALKENLRGVYTILAHAEAQVHQCEVEETHFHEVGNAAAIQNALEICAAFHVLDPELIVATPVQTGSGQIQCAHGLMDIPAPATAVILQDIPHAKPLLEGELCTPTSAAILRNYVMEFVD